MQNNAKLNVLFLRNQRLSLSSDLGGKLVSLAFGFIAVTTTPCIAGDNTPPSINWSNAAKKMGAGLGKFFNQPSTKNVIGAGLNAGGAVAAYGASAAIQNATTSSKGQQQYVTLPDGSMVPMNTPTATPTGLTTPGTPQTVTLSNGQVVTIPATSSGIPAGSTLTPATSKSITSSIGNTFVDNLNTRTTAYSTMTAENLKSLSNTGLLSYPVNTVSVNGKMMSGIVLNNNFYPLYQSQAGSPYPYYINNNGTILSGQISNGAFYVQNTAIATTGTVAQNTTTTSTKVPTAAPAATGGSFR